MANFQQLRAAETQAAEFQSIVDQRQQQIDQEEKNLASTHRILPVSKQMLLRTTAANRPQLAQAQVERTQQIATISQQVASEKVKQQQYKSELQSFQSQIAAAQAEERDLAAYNAAQKAYEHRAPLMGYEGRERYWLQRFYREGAIMRDQENKSIHKLIAELPAGETLDLASISNVPEYKQTFSGGTVISSPQMLPAIKSEVLGRTVPLSDYNKEIEVQNVKNITAAGNQPYYENNKLVGEILPLGTVVRYADLDKQTQTFGSATPEQLSIIANAPKQYSTPIIGPILTGFDVGLKAARNFFSGGSVETGRKAYASVVNAISNIPVRSSTPVRAVLDNSGATLDTLGNVVDRVGDKLTYEFRTTADAWAPTVSLFTGKVVGAVDKVGDKLAYEFRTTADAWAPTVSSAVKAVGSIPITSIVPSIWGTPSGKNAKITVANVAGITGRGIVSGIDIAGDRIVSTAKGAVSEIGARWKDVGGKLAYELSQPGGTQGFQDTREKVSQRLYGSAEYHSKYGTDSDAYKKYAQLKEQIGMDVNRLISQGKITAAEGQKLYDKSTANAERQMMGARYNYDPDVLTFSGLMERARAVEHAVLIPAGKIAGFVAKPQSVASDVLKMGAVTATALTAGKLYGLISASSATGAATVVAGTAKSAAFSSWLGTGLMTGAKGVITTYSIAKGAELFVRPRSQTESLVGALLLGGGAVSAGKMGMSGVKWFDSGRKIEKLGAAPSTQAARRDYFDIRSRDGVTSGARSVRITPSRFERLLGRQPFYSMEARGSSVKEVDRVVRGLSREYGISLKAARKIATQYRPLAQITPVAKTSSVGTVTGARRNLIEGSMKDSNKISGISATKYTSRPFVRVYQDTEVGWAPLKQIPVREKGLGYTGLRSAPIDARLLSGKAVGKSGKWFAPKFVTTEKIDLVRGVGTSVTKKGNLIVDRSDIRIIKGEKYWASDIRTSKPGMGKLRIVKAIPKKNVIMKVAPGDKLSAIIRGAKQNYVKSPVYYEKGTREAVDLTKVKFGKVFTTEAHYEKVIIPRTGKLSAVGEVRVVNNQGRLALETTRYNELTKTVGIRGRGLFYPPKAVTPKVKSIKKVASELVVQPKTTTLFGNIKARAIAIKDFGVGVKDKLFGSIKSVASPKVVPVKPTLKLGPDFWEAAKAEGSVYRGGGSAVGRSKTLMVSEDVRRLSIPNMEPVKNAWTSEQLKVIKAVEKIQPQFSSPLSLKTIQVRIPTVKTISSSLNLYKLSPMLLLQQTQLPIQETVQRPMADTLQIPQTSSATLQSTTLIPSLVVPQTTVINTITTPGIKFPSKTTIQAPEVPPLVPIIDPEQFMKKKKKKELKRGSRLFQTQVRVKGKYVALPGFAVRGKALKKGERAALSSPIASFKIVPTRRVIAAPETKYKPSSFFFRDYSIKRGKPAPLKDEYIQRRRRRIWSTGEVAGTSWKGGKAVNTRASRKRSMGRMSQWNRRPLRW